MKYGNMESMEVWKYGNNKILKYESREIGKGEYGNMEIHNSNVANLT